MNSIWIARDEDGSLYAYGGKPTRKNDIWFEKGKPYYEIDDEWFPDLHWEDEPIELIIKEKET